MENVANELNVVNAVKVVNTNNEKKEEKTMENTNTNTITFTVERNTFVSKKGETYDPIRVTFSEKPEREILDRLNKGFEEENRSKRFTFNFKDSTWSTFRFNSSKELDRSDKEKEIEECKIFIQNILTTPLTEEEEAHKKDRLSKLESKGNSENKAVSKVTTKKNTKKTTKAKKTAKTTVKKETVAPKTTKEEKIQMLKTYVESLGMTLETFKALPKVAQETLLLNAK